MGYDEVIPLVGGFGRYQRRIYFLLCLPAILCAIHKLANVFLQAVPNFRCQLSDEYANETYPLPFDTLNASYPRNGINGTFSSCSMIVEEDIVPCNNYIYDHSIYISTTVTDWDLVCDKSYMKALGDSLFMFGVMVGSIVFGDLSDRYGRKIIFFVSLVLQVVFGTLASIAPEFWTFTICRAIVGSTTSGVFLVAYVIALEMVGPKDRLAAGTICHMFFSLGYLITGGAAFYIREWRYLQVALTLPGAIFLCYWWFIPESARWLVLNNRVNEATALMQVAAKENKIHVTNSQLEAFLIGDIKKKDPNEKKATILDIFRHPNLRKCSLLIFFDWFANNITYYGLSWNTSNLGGNDYINFLIAGAVEIPGYTFLLLTLNKWGRKTVLCGCMVTASIALLLTAVVPQEPVWIITLAMIGKLSITASYGTVYIFSTEQFPTVIRNAGLGACSTSARIGSILAPIINLTNEAWKPLPMVIFGILSLIGGCLSLLLPETLNRELPETISDSEHFAKNRKPLEIVNEKESERLQVFTTNTRVHEETKPA